MIYAIYVLSILLVSSLISNIILIFRKPQQVEEVTRTQGAEDLLAELVNNGAVNIQVYPSSEYMLRSPRG